MQPLAEDWVKSYGSFLRFIRKGYSMVLGLEGHANRGTSHYLPLNLITYLLSYHTNLLQYHHCLALLNPCLAFPHVSAVRSRRYDETRP